MLTIAGGILIAVFLIFVALPLAFTVLVRPGCAIFDREKKPPIASPARK